jgi:carboxyl-terminal processing protease
MNSVNSLLRLGPLALLALFLVSACRSEPRIVEVTVPVEREVEVTATISPEPTETPAATLPPMRATLDALVAAVTTVPQSSGSDTAVIADDDYVALVEQACALVEENYVRGDFNGVDWAATCDEYLSAALGIYNQEAFWDLMEDLVGELGDNHSRFVRPGRFATEFNLPAEGEGIPWPGLTIWPAREDERIMLWDVCQVGAAADAGLRRGDVILAINGEAVEAAEGGFDNAALYDQGDSATLTVLRGPDMHPEEVTLHFGGAAGCDGRTYGFLSETPRIGYLRVPSFSGGSDESIMEAITALEEQGPLDGLVVDIRHNPGGNSDRDIAIFTEGTFGKLGPIRDDATQTIYRIRGPVRWNETTPMAVLIDGNSHSAAEYFATAMQQSGRAILVGMPTAGNTEAILGFNLADGSLIRLAISSIVLPDGSTLEGVGVIPDILVPLGDWGLREVPDVQLAAAHEAVLGMINRQALLGPSDNRRDGNGRIRNSLV